MKSENKFIELKKECAKYGDNCHGCPLKYSINFCPWASNLVEYKKHMKRKVDKAYNDLKLYNKDNQAVSEEGHTQETKADAGKPRVSLVPMQIVSDIARIREYGCDKYHDPENWKRVEKERYIDALGRHALAFLNNPIGVDEESGLPHLWHLECNAAFLSELMKGEFK